MNDELSRNCDVWWAFKMSEFVSVMDPQCVPNSLITFRNVELLLVFPVLH
jgi:hypothetical protein